MNLSESGMKYVIKLLVHLHQMQRMTIVVALSEITAIILRGGRTLIAAP